MTTTAVVQMGSYPLGRSSSESDRLDAQLLCLTKAADGWLYHPSLGEDLSRFGAILDCAAGTLAWTKAFLNGGAEGGRQVKVSDACEVEACDISEKQFRYQKEQCLRDLYVHDVTVPWPEEKRDRYDLVNQRLLIAALTSEQWTAALKNLHGALREGGYLNLLEFDTNVVSFDGRPLPHSVTRFKDFWDLCCAGKHPCLLQELPNMLQEAGFVDVDVFRYKIPLGRAGQEFLGWPPRVEFETVKLGVARIIEENVACGNLDRTFKDGEDLLRAMKENYEELDRVPCGITGAMVLARKRPSGEERN